MSAEQIIMVLVAISIGILGGIAHATNNRLDELERKVECHISFESYVVCVGKEEINQ